MTDAPTIDSLIAAGRHAEAAAIARDSGDLQRACELYEQIWEFGEAARAARDAGDLRRALRNAVEARDADLTRELADALAATGPEGARAAIDVLADRRHFAQAAELAERIGELERAAELYRDGRCDLDAARVLEALGRDREAGRLLERLVEHGGGDPALAPARLRLGLLLARRMRHQEAVRYLQEAARFEATRARAQRALVVELAALGLRDAARDALVTARSHDDSLPVDLDELIRTERGDLQQRPEPGADAPADAQVLAGRYRLDHLIGAGGAGRVYHARDEITGRRVAVKVLSAALARGREAYERFAREAEIAGGLHHPNVVEVLDFSAEQGFLVMELMEGGSLADRLVPRLPAAQVRRMALDVLAGLEAAHRRGVVHRDVKPHNVFFDARGTAKLGDFGVAHLLDLGQTQTGGLIGTLAYMSPEQITGARLTFAADLYALGITLFEALTGRLPFLGPDFVAQHLGETPPAPSAVCPDVPAAWDAIIGRLLRKSPGDRYDSVDALRREIEEQLAVVAAPKPLVLPRAPAASGAEGGEPAPARATTGELAAEAADDDEPRERYRYETSIGRTDISQLSRAVDSALDRSVIIERFDEGAPDQATEQRLYSLARNAGPFLQRALAYSRERREAVFETPAGRVIATAFPSPPKARTAVRLLKRLARAIAPLHAAGVAHGAIDGTRILLDDQDVPTLLACGLGTANPDAKPADDVAAILELVAATVGATGAGIVDALAPQVSAPERAALAAMATPRTGEQLYELADALEIAILRARAREEARAAATGTQPG